ncbi:uncharacterized protein LOC125864108 [Solanum stenotomum]|uniref:uncharacterized protein LOC125864108 n=1 Tax=Solanum stenotomum TaxID=172797 RepID=UPI0020D0A412|nr:uncharacterized protein LOC125864108 [Solanum stenotomum]
MTSHRSFHNSNHHQRGYNSRTRPNYLPSSQYNLDDYVNPNAYDASFAQYEYSPRQFRNGNYQQRGYNLRRRSNYQTSRQYNLDDYVNPNAYDASFAQYECIARQFRNGNHQQRGNNSRRHPNYQTSRQYNIDDYVNPNAYDASFAQYEYTDRQFRNGYHQQRQQQQGYNSRNAPRRPNYQPSRQEIRDFVFVLDHEDDHGDVLKHLKIRIHHAPEVVAPDVESDICAICQSEYENEENIGALQCGHEYHTDCIKQWLMRKTDCPMCRALVLPSQEQKL